MKNGTDAGSESRSKIYFDYAEQQGGKDREAGLKRGTSIPPPSLRSSSPLSQGDKGNSHAEDAKDAECQCKLRCRWISRSLRATENAEM